MNEFDPTDEFNFRILLVCPNRYEVQQLQENRLYGGTQFTSVLRQAVLAHLVEQQKFVSKVFDVPRDDGSPWRPLFLRYKGKISRMSRDQGKQDEADPVDAQWCAEYTDDFSPFRIDPLGSGYDIWVAHSLAFESLEAQNPTMPWSKLIKHLPRTLDELAITWRQTRLQDSLVYIRPADPELRSQPKETHKLRRFVDFYYRRFQAAKGTKPAINPVPHLDRVLYDSAFGKVEREYGNATLMKNLFEAMKALVDPDLSIDLCRGFLFSGPPGTGKSTIIMLLCKYLGLALAHKDPMSPSDFLGSLVGETEAKLQSLLDRSYCVPWLPVAVIIDEVESLVPDRNSKEGKNSTGTIPVLLNSFKGPKDTYKNNFYFSATNIQTMIDPAILRRFSVKLFIGLTSPQNRRSWKGWPARADIRSVREDMVKMTVNFSGANMNDLVNAMRSDVKQRGNGDDVVVYSSDQMASLVTGIARKEKVQLGSLVVPAILERSNNDGANELSAFVDWLSQDVNVACCTGRVFIDLEGGSIEVELQPGVEVQSGCSFTGGFGRDLVHVDVPRAEREAWLRRLDLDADFGQTSETVRVYRKYDGGMLRYESIVSLLLEIASKRGHESVKSIDWSTMRAKMKIEEKECMDFMNQQLNESKEYSRSMVIFDLDAAGLSSADTPSPVYAHMFVEFVQSLNEACARSDKELFTVAVAKTSDMAHFFRQRARWPRGWHTIINDLKFSDRQKQRRCKRCGKLFKEEDEQDCCLWHIGVPELPERTWFGVQNKDGSYTSEVVEDVASVYQENGRMVVRPPPWNLLVDDRFIRRERKRLAPHPRRPGEYQLAPQPPRLREFLSVMKWSCCGQDCTSQECPVAELNCAHTDEAIQYEEDSQEPQRICLLCGKGERDSSLPSQCSFHPYVSPSDPQQTWCNFCCVDVKTRVGNEKKDAAQDNDRGFVVEGCNRGRYNHIFVASSPDPETEQQRIKRLVRESIGCTDAMESRGWLLHLTEDEQAHAMVELYRYGLKWPRRVDFHLWDLEVLNMKKQYRMDEPSPQRKRKRKENTELDLDWAHATLLGQEGLSQSSDPVRWTGIRGMLDPLFNARCRGHAFRISENTYRCEPFEELIDMAFKSGAWHGPLKRLMAYKGLGLACLTRWRENPSETGHREQVVKVLSAVETLGACNVGHVHDRCKSIRLKIGVLAAMIEIEAEVSSLEGSIWEREVEKCIQNPEDSNFFLPCADLVYRVAANHYMSSLLGKEAGRFADLAVQASENAKPPRDAEKAKLESTYCMAAVCYFQYVLCGDFQQLMKAVCAMGKIAQQGNLERLSLSGNEYAKASERSSKYLAILVDANSTGDEALSLHSLEKARDRLVQKDAFNFESQLMLLSLGIAIVSGACSAQHIEKDKLKAFLLDINESTFLAELTTRCDEFQAPQEPSLDGHELQALIVALNCWRFIKNNFSGPKEETRIPSNLIFKSVLLSHMPAWRYDDNDDDPFQIDDASFRLQPCHDAQYKQFSRVRDLMQHLPR